MSAAGHYEQGDLDLSLCSHSSSTWRACSGTTPARKHTQFNSQLYKFKLVPHHETFVARLFASHDHAQVQTMFFTDILRNRSQTGVFYDLHVAHLWQRECATHALLRFAESKSASIYRILMKTIGVSSMHGYKMGQTD